MNDPARIDPARLLHFGTDAHRAAGMPDDEAHLAADTLVQADLWGHQSHGVLRLPWYLARLRSGACTPAGRPELLVDAGAIGVWDGHDGMGQVLAARAMQDTIARAKRHGIGAVAVRNPGHFGTAMYYTLMAARAGCIGFLATNASPAMAPWGGRRKSVGNNPWSWAAPAGRFAPLVLDIANTGVARGKIYLAKQKGLRIPEGWAITADGAPTTDPAAAIKGIILPMAGHKGYGISVVMDMLSGVLSGGSWGVGVNGPYQAEKRSGAGHFMIVLDIPAMQPLADFERRMETFVGELHAVPLAEDAEAIFYPGEIEARNDTTYRAEGLLLPADTLADLAGLSNELGFDFPSLRKK